MRLRNTQSYEKKYGSLRSNKYDKVEMKKRENVDFYVLIKQLSNWHILRRKEFNYE